MADVASKQQTTTWLFIYHSHTHKKTHRTDKKPFSFSCSFFFTQLNCPWQCVDVC